MATHEGTAQNDGGGNMNTTAGVVSGEGSYGFFYIILGFALTIEGSIIMASPLGFFCNVFLFIIIAALTFYFILYHGWVHDKLIGWKNSYESRAH